MSVNDGSSYAKQAFNSAEALINANLNSITKFGTAMQSQLSATLDSMANVQIDAVASPPTLSSPSTPAPAFSLGDVPPLPQFAPLATDPMPVLDSIDTYLSNLDLDVGDLPQAPDFTIALNIPAAPPAIDTGGIPARPAIDMAVTLPSAPDLSMPVMDSMLALTIPEFSFPEIADFAGTPPTASFPVPNPLINWTEPVYASEILGELSAIIKEMMAGGTGLPPVVEQALFDRARQREDQATAKVIAESFDTFAAKNFSLPPGALVKQVNVATEQGRMKAAEINRDILTESAKWEIENLRFAVQQGIALEGLTLNLFENAAKRTFEVAKFYAESQISIFNAQVSLYNAQNQGFQTLAMVYKTKLDGTLAKITAYKTAVDAQAVLGTINEQKVKVYTASLQGVAAQVDIYKAVMSGAQVRSDLIKSQIEVYRTDVQAYAEKIGAQKVVFEAYKSQIEGETAKAGIVESRARAYAATIQGFSAKADVKVKGVQANIEAAKALISKFEAEISGYKASLETSVQTASYQTTLFKAQVDAFSAKANANVSAAGVTSKFADMNTQTNIAYAQMAIKEYEVRLSRAVKEAEIAMEGLKAAGASTAQLAAGAMSALHMSAGISGSGSLVSSGTSSSSTSKSESTSYNYDMS
ncbi:hypothetical protein [Propionivibrio sp.]|uniref:hypothetical protein n=1 Tax=Propionivibrio sp. TaxID=2212460 RepID=UPI003BF0C101